MINRQALLADLQKLLQRIEADLLERSESTEVPEVPAALYAEFEKAAKAERTAQNYEDWRTDTITQAAAAWVLSCVFVRFLEDNAIIDPPKIAGPGDRLERARDEYEVYFLSHPQHTDREYLLSIFGELAKLSGTRDIFGEHNAINDLPNWLSGDAAGELMNFFQKIDASTGDLVHDFTDPNWDTRFLGDLYQDLSEAARKKFALLQTPDFVEEFILDRTLEPAIEEFGLVIGHSSLVTSHSQSTNNKGQMTNDYFKMIDPACGSGHFLLGAFPRLLDRWRRKEPGTNTRELTQRALDSIHGIDINPFAVAIAKFRLLLVAMNACGIKRLADAPGFRIRVACGDSLLHGENRTSAGQQLWDYAEGATDEELYSHAYPGEDLETVRALLEPGTYHCVVANPPYIVPRDRKLNDWYRKRFTACHRQYSLAVPFMQQIFQLAVNGGFTGQITANSFMKAEFGKKLIESFIPLVDLTHVIDTSGAYIPGHGTPTVILFGRNRASMSTTLRTVMGIRGEPSTPEDPASGLVWTSITTLIDQPGESGQSLEYSIQVRKIEDGQLKSDNSFVSVADSPRPIFHKHPWSIGGGGASELKELLVQNSASKLELIATEIGFACITKADDLFAQPDPTFRRNRIERNHVRPFGIGEDVRDWNFATDISVIFPYDENITTVSLANVPSLARFMWPARTELGNRIVFGGKTYFEACKPWYEYGQIPVERAKTPMSIVFAFVATHNHFVLDRGGKVFKQTAPVIKLPREATEDDHLALLGILNSSVGLFYLRQVCFPRGGFGHGKWEERFNINAAPLGTFPLPADRPLHWTRALDELAQQRQRSSPARVLQSSVRSRDSLVKLAASRAASDEMLGQMIAAQEELDWDCYERYGLIGAPAATQSNSFFRPQGNEESAASLNRPTTIQPPPLKLGQRAFEIFTARKMAAGETQSTWFERHGSTPITDLPSDWPEDYKKLVERRIELIENVPNIRLIEQPEYKRRWNTEPWESQLERALREWLLLRLENYFDFDGRMTDFADVSDRLLHLGEVTMYSVAQLSDAARRDPQFMEVGELYRDDPAFDAKALIEELVLAESVPHLPILRYKDSGLRKRAEWEKTWDLQRREDAGESVGTIPVPPKYTSADFISTGGARYWALRGKLDVPKERWISFPHCEGPDGTLVICWAGYDHLQQAQAISAYYVRVQTEFGGSDDPRLIPLLASLIELIPWLKQWHNEPNANFDGLRMGDYFEGFVNEEARNLGKTLAEIKAWVPPKKAAKTAAPKSSTKKTSKRKVAEEASQAEGDD